jgi:nucleoside-triphosphatase
MKHIFLTGEIQVGKSTVIQKTLQLLNVKYGGFRTYFGTARGNPNRCLYINNASHPATYNDTNIVARFSPGSPPEISPERFDTLGTGYIQEARKTARLIIMDELGNLENQASLFQRAVLDALDGDVPILGVVKFSATGWVDEIRNHPKVRMELVTEENRNRLALNLVILHCRY